MSPPSRLIELAELNMTHPDNNYCAAIKTISMVQNDSKEREAMEYVRSKKFSCVGAKIGGGFQNTKEIHVMKYKEAMTTNDKDDWESAVEDCACHGNYRISRLMQK